MESDRRTGTSEPKKVFLTGATGFVGRNMAVRLLEDGHKLTCMVRDAGEPGAGYLQGLGAELAVGDILNADSIAAAAMEAQPHTFIHLVGIILEHGTATFENIHVKGTINALAGAAVAGSHRFLHMSALGAAAQGVSEYYRSKWRAEEAVRSSGLPYTIFRPSIIYGPGGDFIGMLLKQVRLLPAVPVLGNGRYRMQPLSVFDVAACYADAITNDRTIDREYDLCGPDALEYNQMIDIISTTLGKRRVKLHIPMPLVRPVALLSERLMSRPLLTRDQLAMMLAESTCDNTDMRDDFGIEPMNFADGLRLLI